MSGSGNQPTLPSFREAFGEYAAPRRQRPSSHPSSEDSDDGDHPSTSTSRSRLNRRRSEEASERLGTHPSPPPSIGVPHHAHTPRPIPGGGRGTPAPPSRGGYGQQWPVTAAITTRSLPPASGPATSSSQSMSSPSPPGSSGTPPDLSTGRGRGGHFSIMRSSSSSNPLSTASSATTYSGLSGNVRPLRPHQYSQYAVEQAVGAGRVDVRYQCPHCQKGFDRPSSLRTHLNSHSGEKPYVCSDPSCGRRFGVLSNKYRHERTAHGIGSASNTGTPRGSSDEGHDDSPQ